MGGNEYGVNGNGTFILQALSSLSVGMETEVEMNFSGELRTETKYVYGNGMGTGMNESSYSQPDGR